MPINCSDTQPSQPHFPASTPLHPCPSSPALLSAIPFYLSLFSLLSPRSANDLHCFIFGAMLTCVFVFVVVVVVQLKLCNCCQFDISLHFASIRFVTFFSFGFGGKVLIACDTRHHLAKCDPLHFIACLGGIRYMYCIFCKQVFC